jgi:hypothetical protein
MSVPAAILAAVHLFPCFLAPGGGDRPMTMGEVK